MILQFDKAYPDRPIDWSVCRHKGGPIKGPPWTPQNNDIVMVQGVSKRAPNWVSVMSERRQSLWQLYVWTLLFLSLEAWIFIFRIFFKLIWINYIKILRLPDWKTTALFINFINYNLIPNCRTCACLVYIYCLFIISVI